MPKDILKVSLKYSGPDVDDGSMSIDDFTDALKGFSSIYGRTATQQKYKHTHEIRITAIKKGSIDIQLVIEFLQDNSEIIGNLANFSTVTISAGTVMFGTVKTIISIVKFFKHTKGQPYTNKIENNNITIINIEGEKLKISTDIYTILKADEDRYKADLFKMIRPLEEKQIENATIEASIEGEEFISEHIDAKEKKFFDPKLVSLTQTEPVWIAGKFNSLTKSTNKGYFYLPDGSRVLYELISTKPENLYKYFISKGVLEVYAIVHLDDNLNKNKIDILDIKENQSQMDFDIIDSED